jgi:hypothetical protein
MAGFPVGVEVFCDFRDKIRGLFEQVFFSHV